MSNISLLTLSTFSPRPNLWLIPTSDISYGKSAVWNNNRLAFYGIHSIAMFWEALSVLGSFAMILHYFMNTHRQRRRPSATMAVVEDDSLQSSRVAHAFITVGVTDIVWCVIAFIQHLYVLIVEILPSKPITMLNGMAFFASFR